MTNPAVRLAVSALIAGLLAFLAQIQAAPTVDGTLLRSAAAGGILAALELLTPLNPTVGLGRPKP